VKAVTVYSHRPRAGRTHLLASWARSLFQQGLRVAPLHLAPPHPQRIACPEGGSVSRATAVLAEACGLDPGPPFESAATLESLRAFDVVLVEAPKPLPGWPGIEVDNNGAATLVRAPGVSFEFPWLAGVDLMPLPDPELDALPPCRPGAPRVGVVTLPHMDNFTDFLLLRGAEWMTAPLPGRFDVLLLPSTANLGSDQEWLSLQGLDTWIGMQRATGCKVISVGSPWAGAAKSVEQGALADFRVLSRLLGASVPAPLPDARTLDQLACAWDAVAPPGLIARC
jgi:hypothetical protein